MSSLKILGCEIKMIFKSKVFVGFLFITAIFTYSLMRNITITGTANTAPFSEWSYSSFLCSVNSLLIPLLLLLCVRIFEKKEKRVRPLIFSTPISDAKYYLMKGIAVLTAYALAAAAAVIVSFAFYYKVFKFTDFGAYVLPLTLFMIIPGIFMFGLGMFLGKINEKLIFALIPIAFMLPILKCALPVWADVFCGHFILQYPQQLIADTANDTIMFLLPDTVIESRMLFLIAGAILFLVVCMKGCNKSRKGFTNEKVQ